MSASRPDPARSGGVAFGILAERGAVALCVAGVLAAAFVLCLMPIDVTDFWWQAKTGEFIVHSASIPTKDVYSWTSFGQPWQVHEWLTEVLFYFMALDQTGVSLLAYKTGLAVLVTALVLWRSWRRCGSPVLAALAALAAAAVLRNFADVRPQMLTFVLLALLLLALDEYRKGEAAWLPYALPLVFVIWANLHGGVVVGLGLVALWCVGDAVGAWLLDDPAPGLKRLGLSLAACAVAVALNPHGVMVYAYPFQVLAHPKVIDYIVEWYSPNFHEERSRAFEFVLLATLTLAVIARGLPDSPGASRRGVRLGEWLVLGALAHSALTYDRNTVPFALAAAPVLAESLGHIGSHMLRRVAVAPVVSLAARGIMVLATAAVGSIVAVTMLPREAIDGGGSRLLSPRRWPAYACGLDDFPRGAVDWMRRGYWRGPLYNDYVWGGYLIWQLHPQRKVFIDGRAEVYYPSGAFDDEMVIHRANNGWEGIMDRRGVQVILTRRGDYLEAALRRDRDWELAFTGPVEVVYQRKSPQPTERTP